MLSKFINRLFIILLIIVLCIKGIYLYDSFPGIIGIIGVILSVCIGFIIVTVHNQAEMWLISRYKKLKRVNSKTLMALLFCISLILKILCCFIFRIDSISVHPDIQVYVETAKEIAKNGIAETYAGYCYTFSHMFWFAMFLSPIVKLFGASVLPLSIYLSFVSTLSELFLFDMLKKNSGKEKAFVVMLLYVLLPGTILLPQYITHEHALLLFVSISMWLISKLFISLDDLISVAVITVVLSITILLSIVMNTGGLVLLIALTMVLIINVIENRNRWKTNFTVIILLLSIVSTGMRMFDRYQFNHSEIKSNYVNGEKVLWTLYVGSNTETQGKWSQEDVAKYDEWVPGSSLEEIHAYRVDLIKERYENLTNNPKQLMLLIKSKLKTIWSVFSYPISYSNETITNTGVLNYYKRYLSKLFLLIEYGVQLVAILWGLVENIINIKRKPDYLYLVYVLFLMGFTAMLLLTECNNKYTIVMQPIILIACFCRRQIKSENFVE